jgi:hypothetical protein
LELGQANAPAPWRHLSWAHELHYWSY